MKILCIPTAKIEPLLEPGKFVYVDRDGVAILNLLKQHGTWIERKDAEEDPTYRQVIPYITIKHTDLNKRLLMTRMTKQGEARLHGKEYIGVGGHIEQEDGEDASLSCVAVAAHREAKEETGFPRMLLSYTGIICIHGEGASEVDRVHIGVVYDAFTTEQKFNTEEADQHNHRWATDDELRAAFPKAEAWTQHVLSGLLKLL
jgi:predicted NUDIX family phosphoesterase